MKTLQLAPEDTVAVALCNLAVGEIVNNVTLIDAIPQGHKFALHNHARGDNIIKYAAPIGTATQDIAVGAHVHTANCKTALGAACSYTYQPCAEKPLPEAPFFTFQAYRRTDQRVGIRNDLWIIPTVGCVNKTADRIAAGLRLEQQHACDDIQVLSHPYGCSQLGDDHEQTRRLLAALARHPNAGGVLIVGLGCENNGIQAFKELVSDVEPERIRFLNAQDVADEEEEGLALGRELLQCMQADVKTTCGLEDLCIGLKCGGSDGFSGITANPLVGAVSDLLVSAGGSSVLTEVPEMFGAEHLLMDRCINESVFTDCVALINDFKDYFERHGQVVYENPSPGNKDGGITTLEDKSLGCVQKGGVSPVVDVLPYASSVCRSGLSLLSAPGNDVVACTALAAAGAHIILFTTGRGTPLGAPVPTIKISSNSGLAERKSKWIDFNAGQLLEGKALSELAEDCLSCVVDIANGSKRTKNEENGYQEIAIFKEGVTL